MLTRPTTEQRKSWRPLLQLMRYVVTGGVNTVLSYLIFTGCIWIHLNPYLAQVIGYVAGMGTSFIFHARWTFARSTTSVSMFYRFVFVNGVLLAMSTLALHITLLYVTRSALLGQALTLVPVTIVGYIVSKRFVFRESATEVGRNEHNERS